MADYPTRNRVLLALRPEAQAFIAQKSLTRPMVAGEVLYTDRDTFTHAVFPHSGLISIMAEMADGKSVEKTSIGHEGFLGFGLILGGSNTGGKSIVQVPGYASWLSIADLDEALDKFHCVRQAMLRYAKALITKLMETVACNSLHSAEQRTVRWLLTAFDSVAGDHLELKQQIIAEVLGLRRATVSSICSQLQTDGQLAYTRGDIKITDIAGLEARACECFQRIRKYSMQ